MNLKPKAHFNKITDIPIDFFKSHKIKGVIIDVDNTIMDLDLNVLDGIYDWIENLKKNDIKICIASNSIKPSKIKNNKNFDGIPYVFLSLKPLRRGLAKSRKILNLKSNEIAEVGDQILTDVLGANRLGMYSILTDPLSPEKTTYGRLKRKIENHYKLKLKIKW